MIPVELFGIDADTVERFYDELPGLVEDAFEDKPYVDALFAIEAERSLDHLNIADGWANNTPLVWNDDLENEVLKGRPQHRVLRSMSAPQHHPLHGLDRH